MAMGHDTGNIFQVSLVQSLLHIPVAVSLCWLPVADRGSWLLIEGLSGLLLIPLWAHCCSKPDWLTSECDSEYSLA
ncbi:hypothetical protein PMIT1313_01849 [Prochlorococcus marinus str. MIT 1313]|nr:hypothetical protein PMIT1313_01849 [Prochlorococcus marinus str. MIT 1313]KZR71594.1 hypothetical protein PMIT1318_01399 [Prochlorococcus marinus str. MIT 1318]